MFDFNLIVPDCDIEINFFTVICSCVESFPSIQTEAIYTSILFILELVLNLAYLIQYNLNNRVYILIICIYILIIIFHTSNGTFALH